MKLKLNHIYHLEGKDEYEDINEVIVVTKVTEFDFEGTTLLFYIDSDIEDWCRGFDGLEDMYNVRHLGTKDDHPEYFL